MRRFLLLLCLLWAAPVWAARITALESQPGRVIITADGPLPAAQAFALSTPFRLVVDFVGVVEPGLSAPGTNSVSNLRAAMFAPGTARLVIDLKAPVIIREARAQGNQVTLLLERAPPDVFAAAVARGRKPLPLLRSDGPPPLPTLATGSFSLPPEFGRTRGAPDKPEPEKPAAEPPAGKPAITPPRPAPEPLAEPQATRSGVKSRTGGKPLVVIDAGHGGKDVGAIAVSGGYEKDITLAIAREAARILRDRGRVRVKLTRDDDRFIPLGGRVRIARDARADLFISIHADSAPNDQARGASVYTLSAVASDAIAERLAARENKADIIGGVNLGVEAPEVGEIMVDLARRATNNVSVQFADLLQNGLEEQEVGFRGEFHHFAAFAVLKAPDVPSVLLETGYVTNKADAERLFSSEGRQRMARGIARAIERHLTGK
ncbi:N-acetylmuramoyl-L-alanine amidase [Sandarakinorhabdus sp. AAP62]|uniref:N-acetylmuramoyl-L-alanine amidase n=1 Tax=Sandarakinorhabdus sp. AAP62 TaxID=1248916 RepID=UPI0003191748|nr:N-acetylmuramoyl-L-alanine amidase [Sandarakinorhabdus sp. AAP62]